MTQKWFIGDTHFCHERILEFENGRGDDFRDWRDMNEVMVARWNSVVSPGDIVYHLGDVVLHGNDPQKKRHFDECMHQLHGRIYLVGGNHDNLEFLAPYVDKIFAVREYRGGVLSHVPLHPYLQARWKFNIHGHLHRSRVLAVDRPDPWYINVSAEQLDYTPISFEELAGGFA